MYLPDSDLNDDDATLIAHALKFNSKLRYLGIEGNNFTERGFDTFSKVVYDTTSFNSVSDCNHSCWFSGISFDHKDLNVRWDGCTIKAIRARKLYDLLSSSSEEETIVEHLNMEFGDEDDSLLLVPQVLASVQHYYNKLTGSCRSGYAHPLSIVCEILSGWKMPELFEISRPTKQLMAINK